MGFLIHAPRHHYRLVGRAAHDQAALRSLVEGTPETFRTTAQFDRARHNGDDHEDEADLWEGEPE